MSLTVMIGVAFAAVVLAARVSHRVRSIAAVCDVPASRVLVRIAGARIGQLGEKLRIRSAANMKYRCLLLLCSRRDYENMKRYGTLLPPRLYGSPAIAPAANPLEPGLPGLPRSPSSGHSETKTGFLMQNRSLAFLLFS